MGKKEKIGQEKSVLIALAMADIRPTPHNPRKVSATDPKVKELAESIKAHGLLQPVICRRLPGQEYELLAGMRRFVAHQLNGAETILAIVSDLDDQAALEVTVLENLQRDNLTPMEEAGGIKSLLASGKSIKEIASNIGKSPAWVARRASLCSISPKVLQKIADEELTVSVAALEFVARLPVEAQEAMERWDLQNSAATLEKAQAQELAILPKAPFFYLLDDETLTADGSCTRCQKRSSVAPLLWHETDEPGPVAMNEKCLDPACYERKAAAMLARQEEELKRKHPNLIRVCTDSRYLAGALSSYQYEKARKIDAGSVPALVVAGSKAGTMIWVIPNEPVDTKAAESEGAAGQAGPKTREEKLADLNAKRWCEVVRRFCAMLRNSDDKSTGMDKLESHMVIMLLASVFGVDNSQVGMHSSSVAEAWGHVNAQAARSPAMIEADACTELWPAVRHQLASRIAYNGPVTQFPDSIKKEAENIAYLFRPVNLKAMFEQVSTEKGFTVPKSWGAGAGE